MKEQNICIFGDSIVWGAFDPECGGWANRVRNYFEQNNYEAYFSSMGICGDTTTNLLERFEREAKARGGNIIIFAIGINDARYFRSKDNPELSLERFRGNIEELYLRAARFAEKIVFVGLTNVDDSKTMPGEWDGITFYDNEVIKQYDAAIRTFCKEKNVPFINVFGLLSETDFIGDGLHPSSLGHKKIFEKVKDFLLEHGIIENILAGW